MHYFLLSKRVAFTLLIAATSLAAALGQSGDAPADEAYEQRIRQQKIGSNYIPADLDDAMRTLDGLTSEASKDAYAAQPEDFVVERLFFSFGRVIALRWGLYDGSRFSLYLKNLGVDRPDGQKEFVMRAYHRYLNDEPIDVRQLAEAYKREKATQDSLRRASGTVIQSFSRKVDTTLNN